MDARKSDDRTSHPPHAETGTDAALDSYSPHDIAWHGRRRETSGRASTKCHQSESACGGVDRCVMYDTGSCRRRRRRYPYYHARHPLHSDLFAFFIYIMLILSNGTMLQKSYASV